LELNELPVKDINEVFEPMNDASLFNCRYQVDEPQADILIYLSLPDLTSMNLNITDFAVSIIQGLVGIEMEEAGQWHF
jgi:hypothetical protein